MSYEQILQMNPDIIIIPTNNMANGQPDFKAADVLADANLAAMEYWEMGTCDRSSHCCTEM